MNIEKTLHYNGTIELCFNSDRHHYTIGEETIDGTTSVLGVIAKPALIYWSANKASEYIDKFLEVGKVIDELEKKKLVDGCKTAHRTLKSEAADIGSMFHDWVHQFISGKKQKLPTNEMLRNAVNQFLDWVKTNKVKFEHSELRVYSQKYKVAGTLDFVAIIDSKRIVGDIKTSSGCWDEYHLQTAFYKCAFQEEFPDKQIAHTVIVRCGKDGSFEIKEMNEYEKNLEAFVGALALYRRLKEMKFNNLTK